MLSQVLPTCAASPPPAGAPRIESLRTVYCMYSLPAASPGLPGLLASPMCRLPAPATGRGRRPSQGCRRGGLWPLPLWLLKLLPALPQRADSCSSASHPPKWSDAAGEADCWGEALVTPGTDARLHGEAAAAAPSLR